VSYPPTREDAFDRVEDPGRTNSRRLLQERIPFILNLQRVDDFYEFLPFFDAVVRDKVESWCLTHRRVCPRRF
jgi:hypothetical protein